MFFFIFLCARTQVYMCVCVRVCVCGPTSEEASEGSSTPANTLCVSDSRMWAAPSDIPGEFGSIMRLSRWRALQRRGSLAVDSEHMHVPPLTHAVPSNFHAIMRFFIIWHGKFIFLMYERAWPGFWIKDVAFITRFIHFYLRFLIPVTLNHMLDPHHVLLSARVENKNLMNHLNTILKYIIHMSSSSISSLLIFSSTFSARLIFFDAYWILNKCLDLSF